MIVVPREVVGRRRYTLPVMLYALALWAIEGHSLAEVRRRVAVGPQVGFTAAEEWVTLRRWARGWRSHYGGTLREAAARAAQRAASFGDGPDVATAAFDGATRATF